MPSTPGPTPQGRDTTPVRIQSRPSKHTNHAQARFRHPGGWVSRVPGPPAPASTPPSLQQEQRRWSAGRLRARPQHPRDAPHDQRTTEDNAYRHHSSPLPEPRSSRSRMRPDPSSAPTYRPPRISPRQPRTGNDPCSPQPFTRPDLDPAPRNHRRREARGKLLSGLHA